MTTQAIGITICFLVGIIAAFWGGFYEGKKFRKIDLSGLGAQEAFAYFLTHEINRHRQDIAKAKEDLRKLDRAGFHAPDIPVGLWIEVRKNR
jgi:hypothetical protein